MGKRVYISADYSEFDGDRSVVDLLQKWGKDSLHSVDFIDMAQVISGSVSENKDCRPCDLKAEFNRQIDASSLVIFIVGDKTAMRCAGNNCHRNNNVLCLCTPYKQNNSGSKMCKVITTKESKDFIGEINSYSYLEHEFKQSVIRKKKIIIFYNSTRNEINWLPKYMKEYENFAVPFWIDSGNDAKSGNYQYLKEKLMDV